VDFIDGIFFFVIKSRIGYKSVITPRSWSSQIIGKLKSFQAVGVVVFLELELIVIQRMYSIILKYDCNFHISDLQSEQTAKVGKGIELSLAINLSTDRSIASRISPRTTYPKVMSYFPGDAVRLVRHRPVWRVLKELVVRHDRR
jgi:hypothetical protein